MQNLKIPKCKFENWMEECFEAKMIEKWNAKLLLTFWFHFILVTNSNDMQYMLCCTNFVRMNVNEFMKKKTVVIDDDKIYVHTESSESWCWDKIIM